MTLRLVVFDVDGTLVDSQADIVQAMRAAFAQTGLSAPDRDTILGTVGLSLQATMVRLVPQASQATCTALVDGYKSSYMQLRAEAGSVNSSPLYPGALEAVQALHDVPDLLLGLATGKSRRGLDILLDAHALRPLFVTHHCADDHPSKPHPSMLEACLSDTGVDAAHAVMIGDTSFDMDMARSAGMQSIGVTWGYHPASQLRADRIVQNFGDVPETVLKMLDLGHE